LIAQPTSDPRVLTLIATLLDPQGVPFRNQSVTFTAEFADATFIPGNDNQGSALTNDAGQARVTLVAGLTTGQMRVTAEAPPALNISTAITVEITAQGFVSRGDLGIIPSSVTFVNPLVGPDVPGPMTIFNATGGTPPYRWNNSNKSLGRIVPIGIPNVNEQAEYTLIGPIPTEVGEALQDTVTLQDAEGDQTTATVLAIFAECTLALSATEVNFGGAVGGEQFDIVVTNGVPPFTATHTFPESGDLSVNQQTGTITFTVATPPLAVAPDTILIRDSRGCTGIVEVTITPAPGPTVTTIVLEADPLVINGSTGGTSTITATVLDENNLPIQGVSVLFTENNLRASISPLTATTDANGRASTTLTVPPSTPAGVVRVTGSARGVSGFVDVGIITRVIGPAGPPADIFVDLFADRSGDNNDGTCTTILSALVVDAQGNPVNDGTRVDWEADPTAGGIPVSVTSPSFTNEDPSPLCDLSAYEDATGLAVVPQPGDALACLKYPQSASGRTVTISATSGAVSDSSTIILPPCPPGDAIPIMVALTAACDPSPISGSTGGTCTITATLLNANNQPLAGVSVFFTTTVGSLDFSTMTTNSLGQATVTLTIPPGTTAGTVVVTGTAGGEIGTVSVPINP
jgi:adhesin/invasin